MKGKNTLDHTKDYYSVLGVKKDSSDAEIKKNYRNLAKKYHPDKHKGDTKAEERFKSISEAYDILGDKKKRQEYDQMRENPFVNFRGGGGGGFRGQSSQQVNMDDLGDIFGSFFGGGARSAQSSRQQSRKPEATVLNLAIPLHLALSGGEYLYQSPMGKRIKLKIPKDCPIDHKMKLSGQGQRGEDLILNIIYSLPDQIKLDGLNVIQTINIPVWDALLGDKKEVTLYNQKKVNVTIKAGSSSHTRLKLGKMGLKKGSQTGDCFLELHLLVPSQLNDEQKELIKSLKYNTTV